MKQNPNISTEYFAQRLNMYNGKKLNLLVHVVDVLLTQVNRDTLNLKSIKITCITWMKMNTNIITKTAASALNNNTIY